jgi:hypothetical protein
MSRTRFVSHAQAWQGFRRSMLHAMHLKGIIAGEALPGVTALMRDSRIAPGFFFERLLCR